jgi:hypothetical protein
MRLLVCCAGARHGADRCRAAETTPCCAGCAAVLALGSRRKTHCTHCVRCARTVAASQITKRASTRADPRAAFLAVAYAARHRPTPRLAGPIVLGKECLATRGHRARALPRAESARLGDCRARCPAFALHLTPRPAGPSPSRGWVGAGAPVRRRGAEGFGRRAYSRASWSDSPQLFERSERSERSEFCGATETRAPQRSRRAFGADRRSGVPAPTRPRLGASQNVKQADIQRQRRADSRIPLPAVQPLR